jgi:ligand-binding sensor domain-containing protein
MALTLCYDVPAQVNNINIRSEFFNFQNGLNSAEIFTIAESPDGFIWLATERGIIRYDGHTFKTFLSDIYDTTTISNNYVKNVCFDKHGRLWAASEYLDIIDTKTYEVSHFPNKDNLEGKYRVHKLTYDYENDEMWVCTEKDIYINKGKTIRLQKKVIPENMNYNPSQCNLLLDNDNIWLCNTYGLIKWNRKNNDYKIYHHTQNKTKDGGNSDGFFNIYKDTKGIIWIGNWAYGLTRFDPVTEKMDNYYYRPSTGQNCVYFASDFDQKIDDNLMLVGTMHGLKIFHKQLRKFLQDTSTNPLFNNQKAFFSIMKSTKSGIWIGSSKGLYRTDLNSRFIQTLPLALEGSSALAEINELLFQPHDKGIDSIVWFTGSYYKLFKYDLVNKKELPLPQKLLAYGQAERGLYDVCLSKISTLWITSLKDTLIGYDINKDKNNDLWLGTYNGLFYYNRKSNILSENKDVKAALKKYKFSNKLLQIEVDQNNNIWMISGWKDGNKGLIFYNPKIPLIKCYNINDNKALLELSHLHKLKSVKNELIIAGNNGLKRYKISESGLVSFSPLPGNSERSLVRPHIKLVDDNQLWFLTKYGIFNYNFTNKQSLEFNNFNSNVGEDLTDLSYSTQSRKIYISRINNLDFFHADSIKKFVPKKVILTNFTVANCKINTIPKDGSSFRFNSDQNSIQFEFSNLSFPNSQENNYFYKVNSDAKWRKMYGNKLSFDGLGKGKYLLQIISSNCYGTINNDPFTIEINIMPPFYQTWWFFLLSAISVGSLFYYLYRLKVKELERLQKVRLSIARDLHDDMGSNLSHIKMLSEVEAMTNPDQPAFNTIVQKMSEVMNNMSEIIWNANPKNDKIEDVLYRIQEYATNTLEPIGISHMSNFEQLNSNLQFDIEQKRHFYLLFKEAINNIGKYSKAKNVTIVATSIENKISITISDDGIGFDPLLIKRGNGLVNMQERAELIKGQLKIITNKNGTKITLTL